MTEAPYPSDTRAKGWRFELDHERIRQSDTWALASPELRPWLLMLWMVAWEQTPCASLPSDNALIAARIGMRPKAFAQCRETLLRGWYEASDGRLYHATMTERVRAMLEKRAKDAARAAGHRSKAVDSRSSPDGVPRESRVTSVGVTQESDPSSTPSTKHQAPSTGTREERASPVTRATRKPPSNFAVSPQMRQWAAENAPGIDVELEAAKMRDHTFSTARTDWDGTFRNWLRKAFDDRPKGRASQQSTDEVAAGAGLLLGFGVSHA